LLQPVAEVVNVIGNVCGRRASDIEGSGDSRISQVFIGCGAELEGESDRTVGLDSDVIVSFVEKFLAGFGCQPTRQQTGQ
jgi:hypothetical protein